MGFVPFSEKRESSNNFNPTSWYTLPFLRAFKVNTEIFYSYPIWIPILSFLFYNMSTKMYLEEWSLVVFLVENFRKFPKKSKNVTIWHCKYIWTKFQYFPIFWSLSTCGGHFKKWKIEKFKKKSWRPLIVKIKW